MRVVVTAGCRFVRTPGGLWTTSGPDYVVCARHLSAFEQVRIVGQVCEQPESPHGGDRVDGDRVEVWPLPYHRGTVGHLRQARALRRAVSAAAAPTDAVILQVPSQISSILAVRLVHVGVGRHQPALARLAAQLGVTDRVTFAGWLPSVETLRRELDAADLFVMPSRTEGLPRALIEAMARALPAVASNVGGIRGFSDASLTPRREAYYRAVREAHATSAPARSAR